MRSTWRLVAAVGCIALAACSPGSNVGDAGAGSSDRTAAPSNLAAASEAADLRTHLDLLLAEHVMIVAKGTAAAVNHSDEYASYTAFLSSHLADLTDVMRSAFGNTAANDFTSAWASQNAYLVDYGIGAATHDDGKAATAMSGLRDRFVPAFASEIAGVSGLPTDPVAQLMTEQILEDKAFIDDAAAQKYPNFYSDLDTAYLQSERFGDALAERIAQQFPDKFPGDPTLPAVDRRVSLDLLLQQHAFLATMATDALVGGRDAEKPAAAAALGINAAAMSRSLSDRFGTASGNDFDRAWTARSAALLAYAQNGDNASKQALMATAAPFARAARAPAAAVNLELAALVKVIDDQRAKEFSSIAADDHAAATSMQPVGDGISAAV